MPRKKKVFQKFIFGDGAKILLYKKCQLSFINNQAFLMQYVMANILWLKLRSGTFPSFLAELPFINITLPPPPPSPSS